MRSSPASQSRIVKVRRGQEFNPATPSFQVFLSFNVRSESHKGLELFCLSELLLLRLREEMVGEMLY